MLQGSGGDGTTSSSGSGGVADGSNTTAAGYAAAAAVSDAVAGAVKDASANGVGTLADMAAAAATADGAKQPQQEQEQQGQKKNQLYYDKDSRLLGEVRPCRIGDAPKPDWRSSHGISNSTGTHTCSLLLHAPGALMRCTSLSGECVLSANA